MEIIEVCPFCHIGVRTTDFYCFNCGKNLHPKPLSTSIPSQVVLYLGSVFLAPLGILWGFRYIRQESSTSKVVGLIAGLLSLATVVIVLSIVGNLFNTVNEQINGSMQILEGL